MNSLGTLCVAALRTAQPPGWLAPWLSTSLRYALVLPVLDLDVTGHTAAEPSRDEAAAAVLLAQGLAPANSRWYLARAAAGTVPPWDDVRFEPTSAPAALTAVAAGLRGAVQVALVATDGQSPPVTVREAASSAEVLLVVLGAGHTAVLGAPAVLARADRAGAHLVPDVMDPPPGGERLSRRHRAGAGGRGRSSCAPALSPLWS